MRVVTKDYKGRRGLLARGVGECLVGDVSNEVGSGLSDGGIVVSGCVEEWDEARVGEVPWRGILAMAARMTLRRS